MIDTAPSTAFRLGVNYWPRRKAMYWWSNFDLDEVEREFDLIADLGMTLIRLFLLWEDWQPSPDRVEIRALDHLHQVCDVAHERGLALDVTFFTGHMSGPSWVPPWMLTSGAPPGPQVRQVVSGGVPIDSGYRNPFTDPLVLDAAEVLLRTVVGELRDHPAIGLWNLGNEPDLFARPPDAAAGRAWVRRMARVIRDLDRHHPTTCGLHAASLVEDNGFRVDQVFAEVDVPVMHGYPMYTDWAESPLDSDFVPALCALTSALCGKPTLMEEFGGCTAPPGEPSTTWDWLPYGTRRRVLMASETELAAYVDRVLPRLVEAGATGALLWCFADYAPELHRRPPCDESRHERHFGLIRADGSLKPHAQVVKTFAAARPMTRPSARPIDLDMSADDYYRDAAAGARRLYRKYLEGAGS